MDEVRVMMDNINISSQTHWNNKVAAEEARARKAHRRHRIREKTLADMTAILALNAGFMGILILMGISST